MRGREVFISDLDANNFKLFPQKNKSTCIFAFSIMLEFEPLAGITNFFQSKSRILKSPDLFNFGTN